MGGGGIAELKCGVESEMGGGDKEGSGVWAGRTDWEVVVGGEEEEGRAAAVAMGFSPSSSSSEISMSSPDERGEACASPL